MKPRGFEFETVLTTDPGKSWFDMSYKNKFTANYGKLYPFLIEESMPGDQFKVYSHMFARLQPLLAPVMQECDIQCFLFYVPNRLVWDQWKKFQSNGDGTVKMVDAASYVPPTHPYIVPCDMICDPDYYHDYNLKVVSNGSNTTHLLVLQHDNGTELVLNELNRLFEFFDYFGVPHNLKPYVMDDVKYYPLAILKWEYSTVGDEDVYSVLNRLSIFSPPVGSKLTQGSGYATPSDVEENLDPEIDFINAIPFYSYVKIWNQYFRSQDYQSELNDVLLDGHNPIPTFNETDGDDSTAHVRLYPKAFEHDYFTSILPDAQRGPDVTLSLAGTARLVNDSDNFSAHPTQIRGAADASVSQNLQKMSSNNNAAAFNGNVQASVQFDITSHTKVDLSGVSAITINALRYANTLQKYEEQLARSGSRYNEMLLALYGVESSDASIQRPIFIGSGRVPITINDVAQQSDNTSQNTPLGTLAGRGIASGGCDTDFYSEENGWIFGLLSIVPRTQYFQGINRHLRKFVNLDYPVPMFAHLGEQEVSKAELYASGSSTDKATLGYLPRFSEFKYHSDEIHGELKTSLNFWTMSRKIQPGNLGAVIDAQFLRADTMDYEAFADTNSDDDHFIIDCTNSVHLLRALPEYSTPQL